jgi:2,3-bisphosphoglycerate-dependent phosphoglycerate mutase
MKRVSALFVSVGIIVACSNALAASNAVPPSSSINSAAAVNNALARIVTTTVIVIRHAEKNPEGCEGPGTDCKLSAAGEKRARTLSYMLDKSGVSVVYSTQCNRTKETVNNYASSKKIPIQFYSSPDTCTSTDAEIASLANTLITSHKGKKIVVVGHDETVPKIIKALGGASVDNELKHDNLFIVTIRHGGMPSKTVSTLHLKYPIDDINDNSLTTY